MCVPVNTECSPEYQHSLEHDVRGGHKRVLLCPGCLCLAGADSLGRGFSNPSNEPIEAQDLLVFSPRQQGPGEQDLKKVSSGCGVMMTEPI